VRVVISFGVRILPAWALAMLMDDHGETRSMRLYLSSYGFGQRHRTLAALVRGDRVGWVIMNALDGWDEAGRRTDTDPADRCTGRSRIVRGRPGSAASRAADDHRPVRQPDFVWVRGGHAFTLRMAMAAPAWTS
jgi:dipeptidase E